MVRIMRTYIKSHFKGCGCAFASGIKEKEKNTYDLKKKQGSKKKLGTLFRNSWNEITQEIQYVAGTTHDLRPKRKICNSQVCHPSLPDDEMFWKACEEHHLHCNSTPAWPSSICLQTYWWCCHHHMAYLPDTPGEIGHLCKDAICRLALYFIPLSTLYSYSLVLVLVCCPGLPLRMTAGCVNGLHPFILLDHQCRCSTRLCPRPVALLPVHAWLLAIHNSNTIIKFADDTVIV